MKFVSLSSITKIFNSYNTKITTAYKKYTDDAVNGLVDSAPEALNTLKELSTALNDDANFATTVTNSIATKVDKVEGKGLSTNDFTTDLKTKLENITDPEDVTDEEINTLINTLFPSEG